MRIAHISDCYLPRLGGIEAQVHGLARRQLAAGHAVTVLTATPGPHGERHGATDLVEGVPVHRLAIRLPLGLPVNPFAPKDVRSILLAGRYDVVHVHAGVVSPFAYDAMKVVLDLGRPMVVTWHCVLGRTEALGQVWERLRDWSVRPIAFTAVSDLAAEPLRRILGAGSVVSVLPNGVDTQAWQAAPVPHGPEVRLASAMRLARRKRPIPLLRMVSEARGRIPDDIRLHLSILGAGPQRAGHAGLGPAPRDGRLGRPAGPPGPRAAAGDLPAHRHLPGAGSRMESFGIAAIEARAAGLPIVARADSGIREFVQHGVEGLLAADDDEMVEAIVPARHRYRSAATDLGVQPEHCRRCRTGRHVLTRAEQEYARAARIVERVG